MSQLANPRSLSVPGFRPARSNLVGPVPISLSFRSNARLDERRLDYGTETIARLGNRSLCEGLVAQGGQEPRQRRAFAREKFTATNLATEWKA